MILVMLTKGLRRHQLQPKMREARNIPAVATFPGLQISRSFCSLRNSPNGGWPGKNLPTRLVSFSRKTNRKFRFVALPAPAPARPWFRPAEAGPEEPANCRTSSNKPACRLPSGQSAHNCRRAQLHPWVTISSVPMQVRRSGELQIQDSSSVSLAGHRRSAPLNRIGQRKSTKVIS